jgi:peptidyl-prolyl cis-trans isomerase C
VTLRAIGHIPAAFKGTKMRLSRTAVAFATLAGFSLTLHIPAALAQTAPAAPAAAAPAKPADPVLAKVNGSEIRLSDLAVLAQNLPEEARQMPPAQLYPQLLDQAIDGKALAALAKKEKLDANPEVARAMAMSAERTLQSALVSREVGPSVEEAKIRARYDSEIAGKPGEEEIHARHILVASEDLAKKLIADIKGGADFATLAKTNSTDPGAASGGDLGFFKANDMLPEFSVAAFALKPGQVADTPVQTRYGWHVIKVEERRSSAAPSYEQAHDDLRQTMISEGINKLLVTARTQIKVERFNPDGSPVKPTDTATPPAKPPVKK